MPSSTRPTRERRNEIVLLIACWASASRGVTTPSRIAGQIKIAVETVFGV